MSYLFDFQLRVRLLATVVVERLLLLRLVWLRLVLLRLVLRFGGLTKDIASYCN